MAVDRNGPHDVTLRDYAGVVWRQKWIVIGVTVAFVALALAYSFTKTPMYEASATLIYETPLDVSAPLSTGSYIDPTTLETELNAVASVIASPVLVASARRAMKPADIAVGYSVSSAPAAAASGTSTSTVLITAKSPSAGAAARAANAYATAFTAYCKSQEQAQVLQAEQVVQSKLNTFKGPVARASTAYVTLQQDLGELQILESTATGNFRILVPAAPPAQPFSPKPARDGAMGLAGGLAIGIGVVLLLEQFDTRVRTADEAATILGMPVLGTIRKLSSKALREQPLMVLSDSHSPTAEAVRKLRGSLEFANVDGDLRSLFITSALQHEGKTLTVCNLALSLAATGVRVVLVDGDLRRPQVHAFLDLSNGTGVSTVLTGKTELLDTVRSWTVGPRLTEPGESGQVDAISGGERLFVLTSGPVPPNAAEIVASRRFAAMVTALQDNYDMVIIDAPSLLAVGDPAAIARCVDGLMVLVDLTQAKRPLLEEAARQLSQMPCRKLGLVVVTSARDHGYGHEHYSYHHHGQSPLDTGVAKRGRSEKARV